MAKNLSLVEFAHPVKAAGRQKVVLAVLYYLERYDQIDEITITELRAGLIKASVPGAKKINLADVLSKSAPYVESPGSRSGKLLWRLTDTGQDYVRKFLGLPSADIEIEHEVGALESAASAVKDKYVRDYLEEAIKCLQVGALRAAVVFIWEGAAKELQTQLISKPESAVNSALLKHDPKTRPVKRIEDFAYTKESVQLLAAKDLGILDKSEHGVMQAALDERNRCGHPSKYSPGVKKVSSVLEDILGVMFV